MSVIWISLVGIVIFGLTMSFGYLSMNANWIERTVQAAATSAGTAGMTPDTVAVGNPQFNPSVVQQTADQIVAENLGLAMNTFVPDSGSPFISAPQIKVVTDNGPFPATIAVPFTTTTIQENYPTVVISVQGDLRNWMDHTVQATYWAAARIYEPGAPP